MNLILCLLTATLMIILFISLTECRDIIRQVDGRHTDEDGEEITPSRWREFMDHFRDYFRGDGRGWRDDGRDGNSWWSRVRRYFSNVFDSLLGSNTSVW